MICTYAWINEDRNGDSKKTKPAFCQRYILMVWWCQIFYNKKSRHIVPQANCHFQQPWKIADKWMKLKKNWSSDSPLFQFTTIYQQVYLKSLIVRCLFLFFSFAGSIVGISLNLHWLYLGFKWKASSNRFFSQVIVFWTFSLYVFSHSFCFFRSSLLPWIFIWVRERRNVYLLRDILTTIPTPCFFFLYFDWNFIKQI